MPDTLPKLLQEIHSVETPSELNSKLSNFESRIAAILSASPDQKNYYVNHTGRELYRKLYNFGLSHLISYSYDSGFRPNLPEWIPSSLTNLLGWYDASDSSTITKNPSNVVTGWSDKSSNNNDLTPFNDPVTESSTQNSLNVIELDGDDYFQKTSFANPLSGDLQVFIVCKPDVINSTTDGLIAQDAVDRDWQLDSGNSSEFRGRLRVLNQTTNTTGVGSTAITGFNVFCASFDWTNDKQYELRVNGSVLAGTSTPTYDNKIKSTADLLIFVNRLETQSPAGKIAEIVIYESPSDTERQKVEGHLAHKWGLESKLPSSHPYKKVSPFIFDV